MTGTGVVLLALCFGGGFVLGDAAADSAHSPAAAALVLMVIGMACGYAVLT